MKIYVVLYVDFFFLAYLNKCFVENPTCLSNKHIPFNVTSISLTIWNILPIFGMILFNLCDGQITQQLTSTLA